MSTIKIKTLEDISKNLFDYLSELNIEEFDINNDYYWFIDKKELSDPYVEPKDLTLGQLSEDLENLIKMSSGDNEAIPYAMVWFSNFLRYLGDNITYDENKGWHVK